MKPPWWNVFQQAFVILLGIAFLGAIIALFVGVPVMIHRQMKTQERGVPVEKLVPPELERPTLSPDRPIGVTVIAIVLFLSAAASCFLLARAVISGVPPPDAARGHTNAIAAGSLAAWGKVLLLIDVAIKLALSAGLWKLRKWARTVAIYILLAQILYRCTHADYWVVEFVGAQAFISNVALVAFDLWVVWQLTRPRIARAFGS
jgi:hypothetical protein